MTRRSLRLAVGIGVGSCYGLVAVAGCGGFGEEAVQAAPDAQAEAASDAPLQTDATGADAATGDDATSADASTSDAPTDSAPAPRCDPTKEFGTPTKVSLGGLDVIVDALGSFQVDPGETRAFLQQASKIRQYALAGNVLTHASAVQDLSMANGFAVSASGLELLGNFKIDEFRRYTRGALTAPWVAETDITLPISLPADAGFQNLVRASYVGDGPVFYFGRFVFYPAAPSTWDIVRAAPGDASAPDASAPDASASDASISFATTFQSELHTVTANGPDFVNDPVMVNERTIYFARWGPGPVPHLARATRPTPQAPWSTPAPVPVGALSVAEADAVKPYAVTPDDCALYFGYAAATDGGPSTLTGPFVLYVSRRPL
jgi:hypothetical protein